MRRRAHRSLTRLLGRLVRPSSTSIVLLVARET